MWPPMLRHPRTTQERRAACASEVDGLPVRAKRNHRQLPTAWDDVFLCAPKAWKKLRRAQYRRVARIECAP